MLSDQVAFERSSSAKTKLPKTASTPSISAHHRLHSHQTVNSQLRRYLAITSANSLDLSLSAAYNHETELFASKFDVIRQPENVAKAMDNRMNNSSLCDLRQYIGHPLIIGAVAR